MNRRRFLKYAGATAAVVGASAVGFNFLFEPHARNTVQSTSSPNVSPTASNTSQTTQAVSSAPLIQSKFRFSGVNISPFPGYVVGPYGTSPVIDHLAQLHVNFVMLLYTLDQDNLQSTTMTLGMPQETMAALTEYCKSKGMRVGWLPFLFGNRGGAWRGDISPADKDTWFKNWINNLQTIANQAQDHGVDLFMVGSEMASMAGETDRWKQTIKSVRTLYSGPVAYGVEEWRSQLDFQNAESLEWLAELDAIGISAYFPLTSLDDPSVDQLKQAWRGTSPAGDIYDQLRWLHEHFGKQIFFSEIGYADIRGANRQHAALYTGDGYPVGTYDPQEQANCYEAFFDVFSGADWWDGCFIWDYTSALKGPEVATDPWSPIGRPAETILQEWYTTS